jgi:hypothetical protein
MSMTPRWMTYSAETVVVVVHLCASCVPGARMRDAIDLMSRTCPPGKSLLSHDADVTFQ